MTMGDASMGSGSPVYPLKAGASRRYLVDQKDAPFLITGDAPQSIIVNLSLDKAEAYFQNRRSHGFNSVWINLLSNDKTGGRPDASTFDGILPFTSTNDFAKPNEPYFQRADAILKLAAKYGLNAILDPVETAGFISAMASNGVAKCRTFGQYIGDRYKSFDNIVWMSGNDYQFASTDNDALVMAVILGIKDKDTRHIHTFERSYPTSSSLDDPKFASVLSFSAAYTYYPNYAQVLVDYNRPAFMPVFMVEGVYEFESNLQAHESKPSTLRRQEYWSNLAGATGQVYGSHYTWTFTQGWETHLDSPGAIQMAYLVSLFESRRWFDLVPDQMHTVVTSGYGTFTNKGYIDDNDYVTAARTPDGSLVMAYMPTSRAITVDMTKLRSASNARWFDPSTGKYSTIAGSPLSNTGTKSLSPPGPNGDGDGDWVLVLEAQ
jgi:hypothetical protein